MVNVEFVAVRIFGRSPGANGNVTGWQVSIDEQGL